MEVGPPSSLGVEISSNFFLVPPKMVQTSGLIYKPVLFRGETQDSGETERDMTGRDFNTQSGLRDGCYLVLRPGWATE